MDRNNYIAVTTFAVCPYYILLRPHSFHQGFPHVRWRSLITFGAQRRAATQQSLTGMMGVNTSDILARQLDHTYNNTCCDSMYVCQTSPKHKIATRRPPTFPFRNAHRLSYLVQQLPSSMAVRPGNLCSCHYWAPFRSNASGPKQARRHTNSPTHPCCGPSQGEYPTCKAAIVGNLLETTSCTTFSRFAKQSLEGRGPAQPFAAKRVRRATGEGRPHKTGTRRAVTSSMRVYEKDDEDHGDDIKAPPTRPPKKHTAKLNGCAHSLQRTTFSALHLLAEGCNRAKGFTMIHGSSVRSRSGSYKKSCCAASANKFSL